MPRKHIIYVRLNDGRAAVLNKIDSSDQRGKFAVLVSGETDLVYVPEIKQRITETEYREYKPAKQPAKRGSKKNV